MLTIIITMLFLLFFYSGFYRVYNREQEVEILIQFGLNQLKNDGQLPIVADYTTFALLKKFHVARERCEFISRLLNANAVATRNCTKTDYDVTKLGARQQTQKRALATAVATTITSAASSSSSNRHSTDSEDSVNTGPQHSSSTAAQTPSKTLSTITKNVSRGNKKRKNKDNSSATTRSTPMPDRLRVRPNGNIAAASPSLSLSQPAVATKPKKPKTTVSIAKKRGHISEDEENDNTPVLHV